MNLQEQDLTPSWSIPSRDVEQTREDNPDPSPPSQEAENEENSECLSKQYFDLFSFQPSRPLLLHSKRAYTYKRVYPQPKPASEDSNPSDPAKESSIYPLTFSVPLFALFRLSSPPLILYSTRNSTIWTPSSSKPFRNQNKLPIPSNPRKEDEFD